MPKDILQVGPLQGEGLLLACAQVLQAGALERSGVDEDGLLSVIRRDEAEAFLVVLDFTAPEVMDCPFTVVMHVGCAAPKGAPFPVRRFGRG
jgi:hypothetical protein